jgi:hypothetical protein
VTHAAQFALAHGAALLFTWILLQQAGVPILSTRSSIVIRSPRLDRNLQPWLDSFDSFNFFTFTISRSAGSLPKNQRVMVLQVWPRSCP